MRSAPPVSKLTRSYNWCVQTTNDTSVATPCRSACLVNCTTVLECHRSAPQELIYSLHGPTHLADRLLEAGKASGPRDATRCFRAGYSSCFKAAVKAERISLTEPLRCTGPAADRLQSMGRLGSLGSMGSQKTSKPLERWLVARP